MFVKESISHIQEVTSLEAKYFPCELTSVLICLFFSYTPVSQQLAQCKIGRIVLSLAVEGDFMLTFQSVLAWEEMLHVT